jgi:negative regulator of replication initiation
VSIMFEGGPLAGQMAPDPDAPPMEEQAPEQSGADLFKSVLADVRNLLMSDEFDEKQKMALSKAESLLQQVKMQEEKEQQDAMGGKLSPGILRKLGG